MQKIFRFIFKQEEDEFPPIEYPIHTEEIMEPEKKPITDLIAEIALSYEGMKEIPGNMGFEDKVFEELLVEVGWERGQAWCAYFAELVWKKAYKDSPETVLLLDKLFTAGAVSTYNNFKASEEFTTDKHPKRGDLVIWQTWKNNAPHWTGHAGIVISVSNDNEFISIEGNTNSQGGREGIEVALKHRKLTFDAKNGLVLKGFIHPK